MRNAPIARLCRRSSFSRSRLPSSRLRFASSNRQAKALVDEQLRENPAVYPLDSTFDRLEWMADLGEAIRLYDRAWTELKMQ